MWGGSFVAIKYVLTGMSPFVGVSFRIGIGLLGLDILFRVLKKERKPANQKQKYQMWVTGVFLVGLPFSLLFWGETQVSAGLAGIINGSVSLWTFLLGMIFLPSSHKFTWQKFFGLLLGFVGIIIIFYPAVTNGEQYYDVLPILAVLGMAISYGVGNLMNYKLLHSEENVNFYANLYEQVKAAFVFVCVTTLFMEVIPGRLVINFTWSSALGVLYLGIFSSAIAWIIFHHLTKVWDAIRASTVCYFMPIVAITLDYILLGNQPSSYEVIGISVILFGVFLIQQKKLMKAVS
jgi:drug/metabolite transporter (DMT)-like permease